MKIEFKEAAAAFLEKSLYEDAEMNLNQVTHLLNLYASSARKDPQAAFQQILEKYGNCDVVNATEQVRGLMGDSYLFQELKKHNEDRSNDIDINPATRLKKHITNVRRNIDACSVEIGNVDMTEVMREKAKATCQVPAIFKPKEESKASESSARRLKKLDFEYRFNQVI